MQPNNFNFPPNIDPQLFSWIACAVGSLCADGYSANEQNSFGNWLILVGQFILTTAAQKQLINSRNRVFDSGESWSQNGSNNNIDFLIRAVNDLRQELENLKNANLND